MTHELNPTQKNLQVAQCPTEKFGWVWYTYEPTEGLIRYSKSEIQDMYEDGFKIEILESIDALISEGLN